MSDLQSALFLLLFCASSRVNYYLRVCHPDSAEDFAQQHDTHVWHCLCELIGQLPHRPTWEIGSLPLRMGGFGFRSACRTSHAAYWGSWVDCLAIIRHLHEHVAVTMAEALSHPPVSCCAFHRRRRSRQFLTGVGFESPDWVSLLNGLRPRQPPENQFEPGPVIDGWQFFAAQTVEARFRNTVIWPRLSPSEQALLRSQSGPMAGMPFSCVPSSHLFEFGA